MPSFTAPGMFWYLTHTGVAVAQGTATGVVLEAGLRADAGGRHRAWWYTALDGYAAAGVAESVPTDGEVRGQHEDRLVAFNERFSYTIGLPVQCCASAPRSLERWS